MGLTKNRVKKIEDQLGAADKKVYFLIVDYAHDLVEAGYFKDEEEKKKYQNWRFEQEEKKRPFVSHVTLIYGENDVREHIEQFRAVES